MVLDVSTMLHSITPASMIDQVLTHDTSDVSKELLATVPTRKDAVLRPDPKKDFVNEHRRLQL